MRRLPAAVAAALLLPAPARPDEVTELRDRVLHAAAKDPADINKFKLFRLKAKGSSKMSAEPTAATFDLAAAYPGKLKATWEFGGGQNKQFAIVCAADDKGWRQGTNFPVTDLTLEELNDFRTDVYGVFSSTLLTLTEPDTKLALAGRSKVGSDPVIGLRLTRRPYPAVTLQFDEKTYLLRRMSYRGRENGVLMTKEMTYGSHKAVGGLTLPTTQTTAVDGREVYTWTEMTFEFPDKLDAKTFDKP
jgi:hypothetical protein